MIQPSANFAAVLALIAGACAYFGWPNQVLFFLAAVLVFELGYAGRLLVRHVTGRTMTPPTALFLGGAVLLPLALVFVALAHVVGTMQRASITIAFMSAALSCAGAIWSRRDPPSTRITSRQMVTLAGVGIMLALNLPLPSQLPDYSFVPKDVAPSHAADRQPLVLVDEGHHELHTIASNYEAFAHVLRADGYRVEPLRSALARDRLAPASILAIINALSADNAKNWNAPTRPAFEDAEITTIKDWVNEGGSLFLIADHDPFASGAATLASAFGFTFEGGYVGTSTGGHDIFSKANGMLHDAPVTAGVDSVRTFIGQAFRGPADAQPIIVLGDGYRRWPALATMATKGVDQSEPAQGAWQLAIKTQGRGRIVVGGEAGMFSAQRILGLSFMPMGMNAPDAKDNRRLLLALVHWLEAR